MILKIFSIIRIINTKIMNDNLCIGTRIFNVYEINVAYDTHMFKLSSVKNFRYHAFF